MGRRSLPMLICSIKGDITPAFGMGSVDLIDTCSGFAGSAVAGRLESVTSTMARLSIARVADDARKDSPMLNNLQWAKLYSSGPSQPFRDPPRSLDGTMRDDTCIICCLRSSPRSALC